MAQSGVNRQDSDSLGKGLMVTATAVPVALAALLALLSDGSFQDDDLTHYLMARWSWEFPQYFADNWGRPGFTVPYALVAHLGSPATGFTASRLMTVAIMAATAWLTWRIAATWEAAGHIRPRTSWLAPAALVTMPLYFRLSFTTLTETTCAFYLAAGTYLLLRDHTRWAAVVFSLVPLTRHEGVILLPVIAGLLVWRRDIAAVVLLLVGEIAWNLAKPLLGYPLEELPILRFAARGEPGHLGVGGPLHYLLRWAEAAGPAHVAASALGIGCLATAGMQALRRQRWHYEPKAVVLLLASLGTAGVVLLQTLLYIFNTHESGGYARFLLPAASWMALCAAAGAGWLLDLAMSASPALRRGPALAGIATATLLTLTGIEAKRQGHWLWFGSPACWPWLVPVALACLEVAARPSASRVRLLITVLAVIHLGAWAGSVRPWLLRPHQRHLKQVMTELATHETYAAYPVVGDNPWIHFFRPIPRAPDDIAAFTHWDLATEGRLLYIWDRDHSSQNAPLVKLLRYPHQRITQAEIHSLGSSGSAASKGPYLHVYERLPDSGSTISGVR